MTRSGTVYKGIGGQYQVRVDSEPQLYTCKARGRLKKDGDVLMVGDRVDIVEDTSGEWVIERVHPRRNELLRPPVANIDQALIVFAIEQPSPSFHLLDKMILSVEHSGVAPILVFNKSDLGAIDLERYRCSGYPILYTSAESDLGIAELLAHLQGHITVLTGPSGVGKSSLLNRLHGRELAETGAVSRVANRGKHTTRHSELFELSGGGIVIDSPGFASIHLDFIDPDELKDYFPEFRPYDGACRFADCRHVAEPGCAVRSAAGNAEFPIERYDSYIKIRSERLERLQSKEGRMG